MDALPDELLIETLLFLDADTLCKLALVNKRFYNISGSNFVWRKVFIRRWETEPSRGQNLKHFYADLNKGVTRIISKFQAETTRVQELLAQEKSRQLDNLNKRLQQKRERRMLN